MGLQIVCSNFASVAACIYAFASIRLHLLHTYVVPYRQRPQTAINLLQRVIEADEAERQLAQ